MRQRTKYRISTALLIVVLLSLTLGFAFLNADLNINGSSQINNPSWNIYWDNVQVTTGSVEAEEPVIDANKTTVTFEVTLSKPGDFYEFTVDAVNAGTIDAMIESITSTVNDESIDNLPNYLTYQITYGDNKIIGNNHLIRAGETETYKARVEYKKDITASDLPSENQEYSFSFTLNKVQANNDSFERKKYMDVEDLKALAIPSGEGLSISPLENNKYIYRGKKPDNYIQLGEDMYRIISIESDNTVKVVKSESIGKVYYDIGKNQMEGLDSPRRANNTYCFHYQANLAGDYVGCNSWGSATTTLDQNGNPTSTKDNRTLPNGEAYLNVYLNGGEYYGISMDGWYSTLSPEIKNIIVSHLFNIGTISNYSTNENVLNGENKNKWFGKVAIVSTLDYVLANTNEECTANKLYSTATTDCASTNWMYTGTLIRTMTPKSDSNCGGAIFAIGANGRLVDTFSARQYETYPAFYLTASLKLTGEGTETNPYKLYQEE